MFPQYQFPFSGSHEDSADARQGMEEYKKNLYSSLLGSFRFPKLLQGVIILSDNFFSLDTTPQQTLPVVKTIFQTSG